MSLVATAEWDNDDRRTGRSEKPKPTCTPFRRLQLSVKPVQLGSNYIMHLNSTDRTIYC